MSRRSEPNEQQQAAIAARGAVFVSAGAGTGKTTVLVERFTTAVCDDGLDVDSLLAITYTDRAAGELRARIAARLRARGRPDLARDLDSAWISTIHGFCRRLLGLYPLAAGIDPRFRVLDEAQSRVLQGEAFTSALHAFCAEDEPSRLQLLATYGGSGLRRMLTSVYETLRSAGRDLVLEPGARLDLGACVDDLRSDARALASDPGATALQRAVSAEALDLLETSSQPEALLDLSRLSARGPRATPFNESRLATVDAALEELAARDRLLLEELLHRFAAAYAAAKEAESALDFEDLQLRVRDLLRDDAEIRVREQQRFRSIMVDEFQDTNRLQTELVDVLTGGSPKELFFVGDEFQSIYGFRHADVAVFRERRETAGQVLPLTINYRSRPELLAAVNHLFAAEFGDAFEPLEPAEGYGDARFGTPVELLVTDKASYRESPVHWRRAEASHVAGRVAELVANGAATPGEIVLLFAAGTDAELYEEELRAVGLPTYRATGRRYFGQQQVVDLLAYLRLLRNRYDDEALLTVLASPFVGVSNDALVLVREASRKRPIFTAIERSLPGELSDDDARLVRAFRQRYERLVEASARLPLELLCERVVVEHDYDLAVLTRADGKRRYANLRKLMRLTRSYEELRGADIEGFVRFVADQEAAGARESDAVAEEEGAEAVRLLTIHAAKGLEFKIVVVADAGRERVRDEEILCLSDGRFGFKVAHPRTGERVGTASYQDVRATRDGEDEAERLRLYYVGMTRAMERLIVSGSVELAKIASERTLLAWAVARLDVTEELERAAEIPVEVERGGAALVLRLDRRVDAALPAAASVDVAVDVEPGTQLPLFESPVEPLPPRAPRLHDLPVVPEPPALRVSRLSFSAISQFDSCSYRFWAERVAGLRPRDGGAGEGEGGLRATEVGDAVHRLLERLDLRRPEPPGHEQVAALVRSWYASAADEEIDRVAAFVDGYCRSAVATRVAGLDGARPEVGFAFAHDGVLLEGRLDVHWTDGRRALVLDYKTNVLGDASPAEVVAEGYRLQRLVYALACLRAGADEAEVVYQFLERPDETVSETFTRGDVPALERELGEAIERIRAGEFRPTPSPFACLGCPALDVVCAGPRLLESRPPSAAPEPVAAPHAAAAL